MPDDRTAVTELATALGMLGWDDADEATAGRPSELAVDPGTWDHLAALCAGGRHADAFALALANGRSFLEAPDALAGRPPRLIEWTGGRRPPGDEVAPIDLRVDHVYLVSCKYFSQNIANPSPARLFDGLLATVGAWDRGDWYQTVAPEAYAAFYRACRDELVGAEGGSVGGCAGLPDDPAALGTQERRALRNGLRGRSLPPSTVEAYAGLCRAVSVVSARRWRAALAGPAEEERMVWRLLRIGGAPYFLLGADELGPLRLRIATPWDWRRRFRLLGLDVEPAGAGQPRVNWCAHYVDRLLGGDRSVYGHVEVRWAHGRFAQPPEAKVYLDSSVDGLPGYFPLDDETAARSLRVGDVLGAQRGESDGPEQLRLF